jgi:hypothetical protein
MFFLLPYTQKKYRLPKAGQKGKKEETDTAAKSTPFCFRM